MSEIGASTRHFVRRNAKTLGHRVSKARKVELISFDAIDPAYTADAQGLLQFLENEADELESRQMELEGPELIRDQSLGEALNPDLIDGLVRYEVHLDRKLERMVSMLIRLKEVLCPRYADYRLSDPLSGGRTVGAILPNGLADTAREGTRLHYWGGVALSTMSHLGRFFRSAEIDWGDDAVEVCNSGLGDPAAKAAG